MPTWAASLRLANIREAAGALYFTGGSTGLRSLTNALASGVQIAVRVTRERLALAMRGL